MDKKEQFFVVGYNLDDVGFDWGHVTISARSAQHAAELYFNYSTLTEPCTFCTVINTGTLEATNFKKVEAKRFTAEQV